MTPRTSKPYTTKHRAFGMGVTIPTGLRVRQLSDGRYVLDEFPTDLFPTDSIPRWDAIHYGVTIPSSHVKETA